LPNGGSPTYSIRVGKRSASRLLWPHVPGVGAGCDALASRRSTVPPGPSPACCSSRSIFPVLWPWRRSTGRPARV